MRRALSPLPPLPQPPHDPAWLLLSPQVGWRDAKLREVEKHPTCGALQLARFSGTRRSLAEESGSFGGLRLPTNVALDEDGSVYLLDRKTLELKWFDPCQCRFETVPCFGGAGEGPRQLKDPHGIGIFNGNLYVCDTGNHRLCVFSLHGFALRAIWKLPGANDWSPFAVAFDCRGCVLVTDSANGCVHKFSSVGNWQGRFGRLNQPTHLAIDCENQVYVVAEDEGKPKAVRAEEPDAEIDPRPEVLAPDFPSLPFKVDTQGNLHLRELCQGKLGNSQLGIFDLSGNPVKQEPTPGGPIYELSGLYLSEALDSKLYRCQWHRVILRGQLPSGNSVRVSTFTSEVELAKSAIELFPEEAWETTRVAHALEKGQWDCLVRSGGGRYLWLRLELSGNGMATPSLESVQIEFPRISLRRYLPAVFGEDPASADFTDRFLALFDTTLRSVEGKIDHQASYFDPLSTPTNPNPSKDMLSWLASWIGLTLDRHWPEAKRRDYVKRAAGLYHLRGTRGGLRRLLLFYLGFEPEARCCPDDQPKLACHPLPRNCEPVTPSPCAWQPPPLILEHFQLRRWLFLGAGRLGDQAVLWGQRIVNRSQLNESARLEHTQLKTSQDPYRDPFHVYAHKFSVFVPASYGKSERHRKALENLLNSERPAHTKFQLEFVEPRFRIGVQAMIGFDSVIGKYPAGVTLSQTPLGQASVLSTPPAQRHGPSLQVGGRARIGSTTKLD